MNAYDYLFKFILIGDTGVGKSCLLMRFVDERFREDYDATIGVEFGSKILNINNYVIKTQIWDTAGQDQFRSITRSYYKGAVGAIVVFDISKKSSFENLSSWIRDVSEQGKADMIRVIVGNKKDKMDQREVSSEEAAAFAQQNNANYIEVSAKEDQNVQKIFVDMAKDVLHKILTNQIDFHNESSGVKIGARSANAEKLKRNQMQGQKEQNVNEPLLERQQEMIPKRQLKKQTNGDQVDEDEMTQHQEARTYLDGVQQN